MTPVPEAAALFAGRGTAHVAGWFAIASFLLLLAAIWDERRREGRRPAKGQGTALGLTRVYGRVRP